MLKIEYFIIQTNTTQRSFMIHMSLMSLEKFLRNVMDLDFTHGIGIQASKYWSFSRYSTILDFKTQKLGSKPRPDLLMLNRVDAMIKGKTF